MKEILRFSDMTEVSILGAIAQLVEHLRLALQESQKFNPLGSTLIFH